MITLRWSLWSQSESWKPSGASGISYLSHKGDAAAAAGNRHQVFKVKRPLETKRFVVLAAEADYCRGATGEEKPFDDVIDDKTGKRKKQPKTLIVRRLPVKWGALGFASADMETIEDLVLPAKQPSENKKNQGRVMRS